MKKDKFFRYVGFIPFFVYIFVSKVFNLSNEENMALLVCLMLIQTIFLFLDIKQNRFSFKRYGQLLGSLVLSVIIGFVFYQLGR